MRQPAPLGKRLSLIFSRLSLSSAVYFILRLSVIAAAANDYDSNKDNDPSAVVVEDVAKAVVIHSMFLRSIYYISSRGKQRPPFLLNTYYASRQEKVPQPGT